MPAYPLYDPEAHGLVYHVVPDPRTYHPESISDITSEAESSDAGMSIYSDDLPEYFIEHHGRQHPASENAVKWFPTDNTKRYILRHVLSKYVYGHNYVGPVKEILRSDPGAGKRPHVLEIGTRDGTWVQEMADEYPHAQFQSLDVVPITAHAPRPNIVFEVYDITKGLLLADNSQDIVFINVALELVKDYRALLLEAHRVLRPGGLIHMREYIPGFWDSQDESKPARRTNPAGCHLFDLARSTITKLGVDPDVCEKLPLWLTMDSGLWRGDARPFEQVHMIVKTYPVYPHDNHSCSSKIDPQLGPLLAHYSVICTRDMFGLLRDGGLGVEEANQLIEAVIEELKDPEKCSLLKLCTVYATKRG